MKIRLHIGWILMLGMVLIAAGCNTPEWAQDIKWTATPSAATRSAVAPTLTPSQSATPTAPTLRDCKPEWDACINRCDELAALTKGLDYKAREVFACAENLCYFTYGDKYYCSVPQFTTCVQKYLDEYFTCVEKDCIEPYRALDSSETKERMRATCQGNCADLYWSALYETCRRDACDEYCALQGKASGTWESDSQYEWGHCVCSK